MLNAADLARVHADPLQFRKPSPLAQSFPFSQVRLLGSPEVRRWSYFGAQLEVSEAR